MMSPEKWLAAHSGYNCLTQDEREAIKHFCLLWSLFEFKLLGAQGSANAIAKKVEELAQIQNINLQPFQASFAYFKARYHDGARFNATFENLRFRRPDNRPLVESVLTGAKSDAKDVVSALLIIVYRLRNNLLHGEKWAYDIHGQFHNFEHANTVLMHVLDIHHKANP